MSIQPRSTNASIRAGNLSDMQNDFFLLLGNLDLYSGNNVYSGLGLMDGYKFIKILKSILSRFEFLFKFFIPLRILAALSLVFFIDINSLFSFIFKS